MGCSYSRTNIKYHKRRHSLRTALIVLACVFAGIAALTFSGLRWMFSVWFGTMEELLFTVTNLSGASGDLVWSFIFKCGSIVLLSVALMLLIHFFFVKKGHFLRAFIIYPLTILISLFVIIFSFRNAYAKLDVKTYLDNQGAKSLIQVLLNRTDEVQVTYDEDGNIILGFIDSNYVDPDTVRITAPEQKRNLIMIYLESMETTYSDLEHGGAYDTNYIPELVELSLENESFNGGSGTLNGGRVLTYSTWTMGGLFTQSTGLPLNLPIGANEMDTQEFFLPSVTALGDILKDEGYIQAFQCGSDVSFGGRKAFYNTHGDYTLYDLNYAYESGDLDPDYYVWWGYEDDKLFEYAKRNITEMAATGQPFNYTMLTVDSHFPDGYSCDDCEYGYEYTTSSGYTSTYGNVLICSSKKVTEFVNWIKEQDFYENTTVVVTGDHLTMDANFCSDVPSNYERKVYTAYINSAASPVNNTYRNYTTEDTFPTVLAAMGFEIEGDQLGLGVNLFSNKSTLLEENGYQKFNTEISKKSDLLSRIGSEVDLKTAAQKYDIFACSLEVSRFDFITEKMTLSVSDIISSEELKSIQLLFYSDPNQADAIWYVISPDEDGKYSFDFTPGIFDTDTCTVEIYCKDSNGNNKLMYKDELDISGCHKSDSTKDLIRDPLYYMH